MFLGVLAHQLKLRVSEAGHLGLDQLLAVIGTQIIDLTPHGEAVEERHALWPSTSVHTVLVALTLRVTRGEHAEHAVRLDHTTTILGEQQAVALQRTLHDIRNVWPHEVHLVTAQDVWPRHSLRKDAIFELGHGHAALGGQGVTSDEVHARDLTVEVDPHERPQKTRCHLLDQCRLARPCVAVEICTLVGQQSVQATQQFLWPKDVAWVDHWHMRMHTVPLPDGYVEVELCLGCARDAEHLGCVLCHDLAAWDSARRICLGCDRCHRNGCGCCLLELGLQLADLERRCGHVGSGRVDLGHHRLDVWHACR